MKSYFWLWAGGREDQVQSAAFKQDIGHNPVSGLDKCATGDRIGKPVVPMFDAKDVGIGDLSSSNAMQECFTIGTEIMSTHGAAWIAATNFKCCVVDGRLRTTSWSTSHRTYFWAVSAHTV